MTTTASILRSIAQLVRRPSPTLIGLTPATTRRIGSLTDVFHGVDVDEGFPKKCSKATVVTTVVLKGFDASDLKTLLPMVQQHFSGGEAKKIVEKHLVSAPDPDVPVATQYGLRTCTEVTLEGLEDGESEILAPYVDEHLKISLVDGPKMKNIKQTLAVSAKSMKF